MPNKHFSYIFQIILKKIKNKYSNKVLTAIANVGWYLATLIHKLANVVNAVNWQMTL